MTQTLGDTGILAGLDQFHCTEHDYHAIGCVECAAASNNELLSRLRTIPNANRLNNPPTDENWLQWKAQYLAEVNTQNWTARSWVPDVWYRQALERGLPGDIVTLSLSDMERVRDFLIGRYGPDFGFHISEEEYSSLLNQILLGRP